MDRRHIPSNVPGDGAPVVDAACSMLPRMPPSAQATSSAAPSSTTSGPSFAVLLFARVDAAGRRVAADRRGGGVFAVWRRPWRRSGSARRASLLAWGLVLAAMNCCFYLAIDRLPLGTVAAIEFLPVIVARGAGRAHARATPPRSRSRSPRRVPAHRRAARGRAARASPSRSPTRCCSRSTSCSPTASRQAPRTRRHRRPRRRPMLVAAVVVTPLGGAGAALPAFDDPVALAAGHRRRHHLVGDPVRLRPARDGAARARRPTR